MSLLKYDNGLTKQAALKMAYSFPVYILYALLIYVPLIILGWILIPLAALLGAYNLVYHVPYSNGPKESYHFTWPFMWLWDNWEDGIAAGRQYKDCGSVEKQIIYWSCIRNPVNNLRATKYLSCRIKSENVKFVGSIINSIDGADDDQIHHPYFLAKTHEYDTPTEQWYFAWDGFYSNFYKIFKRKEKLYRLWIGFKIMPKDIYKVSDYRSKGSGFAIQFKRVA